MQKELGKRGDYCAGSNDCRDYSKDLFNRMKAKLMKRRKKGIKPE